MEVCRKFVMHYFIKCCGVMTLNPSSSYYYYYAFLLLIHNNKNVHYNKNSIINFIPTFIEVSSILLHNLLPLLRLFIAQLHIQDFFTPRFSLFVAQLIFAHVHTFVKKFN